MATEPNYAAFGGDELQVTAWRLEDDSNEGNYSLIKIHMQMYLAGHSLVHYRMYNVYIQSIICPTAASFYTPLPHCTERRQASNGVFRHTTLDN